MPDDQPVRFQFFQRFGQHSVGNAGNFFQDIIVSMGRGIRLVGTGFSRGKRAENRDLPFSSDGPHRPLERADICAWALVLFRHGKASLQAWGFSLHTPLFLRN